MVGPELALAVTLRAAMAVSVVAKAAGDTGVDQAWANAYATLNKNRPTN